MAGTLQNPSWRDWGGEGEKEWTDCGANDLRLFGIGDGEEWKAASLDPGKSWEMVIEGGQSHSCTFMTARMKE